MKLIFIYGAIFVATLVIIDSLTRYISVYVERKKYINYRLKLLEGSEDRRAIYEGMLRERALNYDKKESIQGWVRNIFNQSGVKLNFMQIVLYVITYAVLGWILAGFVIHSPINRFLLLASLAVFITIAFVVRARSGRIKLFLQQLPEALDIITRSLSSGHPLATSINLVSREMRDPIGSEFGILNDELTYGIDIEEAMRNMLMRVGAGDLKLLAISLSVQKGTGGNLIEILSNLSTVIRHRAIIKAKVKSLSAEGRMTSWVMLAFPFFLYSIIVLLSPTYFDPLWESGYGNVAIITGSVMMTIGIVVIRKIVNFDI